MGPGKRKIFEIQEESKKIEKRTISLREKEDEGEEKMLFEFAIDILQRKDPDEFFTQPATFSIDNYGKTNMRLMDFGTIRAKIKEKEYKNSDEFKNDVYLLCVSSMRAHHSSTKYFQVAEAILTVAKKIFEDLSVDGLQRFYLDSLDSLNSLDTKTQSTAPSRKCVQPTIGHARFRRKVSEVRDEDSSPNSEEVGNAPKPNFELGGGGRQFYCNNYSVNKNVAPNLEAHDVGANSSHVHALPKPMIPRPPRSETKNQVSGLNTSKSSLRNFVWPARISRLLHPNYTILHGLNLPKTVTILPEDTEKKSRTVLGNSMAPFPVPAPPHMFPYSNFAVMRRNMHQPTEKEEEKDKDKEKGKEKEKEKGKGIDKGKEKVEEGSENDIDEPNLDLKL